MREDYRALKSKLETVCLNYSAVEEEVRRRLSEELDITLAKHNVLLLDEDTVMNFDFVSLAKDGQPDGRIIGEVKTSSPIQSGKHKGEIRRSTQFGDFSRDIVKLLAAKDGKEKWLVLVNDQVCTAFRDSKYGKATKALGIKIVLCPLSQSEPIEFY